MPSSSPAPHRRRPHRAGRRPRPAEPRAHQRSRVTGRSLSHPRAAASPAPALVAAPLTVSQAVASQTGQSATVRGYVVGQPTATSTVVRSGFPSDYALAIADSAAETSTSRMLYVQIPSAFRSAWGLKAIPRSWAARST